MLGISVRKLLMGTSRWMFISVAIIETNNNCFDNHVMSTL